MYNQFIKKITADLSQYFNYESLVENSEFNAVDADGNDVTQKVKSAIVDSGEASDSMLKLILNNSIATIQYLGNDPSRHDQVLKAKPNFADVYLSDINFCLYYIDKVLGKDVSKNSDFITKCKNLLTTKNTNLIPAYIYVTGDVDQDLVNNFVRTYYLSGIDKAKENTELIKDFIIALQQHRKLDEQAKDLNVMRMIQYLLSETKNKIIDTNKKNTETNNVSNVFNLDLNSIDNLEFINFFNELNTLGQGLLTNKDINPEDINPKQFVDTYLERVVDFKSLETLLSDSDVIKSYAQTVRSSESGKMFYSFLITLLDKVKSNKTASIRGKKMFKLAKAYTRYYIKNMLLNMLRCAGNDPKAISNVIKVSTDEIQNLMYGDTINHPENLAEVNNPAVRDQIASDVEQAVKGDQISGGAADDLSIEDIAKKWSEIYKQVPYEYLLDVLKTQEQAGSIVEQEHTDNLEIAKEIARDHLAEAPDYYTHLENMEEVFPAENVSERPLPEPEGIDLQILDNPLPKDEKHICDGSCGGNCKCHHDKVQTVEDKIKGLDGDDMVVIMVEETPEVETVEEQPLEFIQQIAAKIKR